MDLQRFTLDTPNETIIEAIKKDGGIVIEGVLKAEDIEKLNATFDDAIDEEKKRKTGSGGMDDLGGLMPDTMYFATNLIGRYPEVSGFCAHDKVVDIATGCLDTVRKEVVLNTCQVIESHPGTPAQGMHRDDATWPVPTPRPELCVVTLWALDNFVPDAGGTVIAPGSHLWPDAKECMEYDPDTGQPVDTAGVQVSEDQLMRLRMEPGSVLIFLGSLVHGGGANISKDLVRRYFHIGYCHSWLRPVENPYVTIDPKTIMGFPPELQRLLGYGYYSFELGHCHNMTPVEYYKKQGITA
jgi:ectoine hydroxylase-related dioxygenase (phytanoyl-CoA dioxygenase family)